MTSQPFKVPTIPIPFHKLMKIVAIVDPNDMQTKELLEQLAAERYVVEVTDSFDRDVSEDASVGAYIAPRSSSRARDWSMCRASQ